MVHYCESCGAELSEGARFCASCGAPIGAPGSAPPLAPPEPAPAPLSRPHPLFAEPVIIAAKHVHLIAQTDYALHDRSGKGIGKVTGSSGGWSGGGLSVHDSTDQLVLKVVRPRLWRQESAVLDPAEGEWGRIRVKTRFLGRAWFQLTAAGASVGSVQNVGNWRRRPFDFDVQDPAGNSIATLSPLGKQELSQELPDIDGENYAGGWKLAVSDRVPQSLRPLVVGLIPALSAWVYNTIHQSRRV